MKEVNVLTRKNKLCIYILCLLVILSIYKDLTRGEEESSYSPPLENSETIHDTLFMHRTVQPGDTLLSIVEEIHQGEDISLHFEQVIQDFKDLNAGVNPYELTIHESYYFPVYTY